MSETVWFQRQNRVIDKREEVSHSVFISSFLYLLNVERLAGWLQVDTGSTRSQK